MPQSESNIQPPMPMHESTPLENGDVFRDGDVLKFKLASEDLIYTEPEVIAERTGERIEDETASPANEEEIQPFKDEEQVAAYGKLLMVYRREEIEETSQQYEQAA